MDEKLEFAQRLSAAMQEAGYEARPAVLEREFNTRYWGKPVTYQAVTRWLKGEAIPAQDKLQILADWLRIEPHILRFGGQALYSVQEKKKRWEAAISGPEREILETFINLPPEQKNVARAVILALARAGSGSPS